MEAVVKLFNAKYVQKPFTAHEDTVCVDDFHRTRAAAGRSLKHAIATEDYAPRRGQRRGFLRRMDRSSVLMALLDLCGQASSWHPGGVILLPVAEAVLAFGILFHNN